MTVRVFALGVVTVIAVLSSLSLVVTTPQVLTARRIHQRLLAESVSQPESVAAQFIRNSISKVSSKAIPRPILTVLETRKAQRLDRQIPDSLDRVIRQLRSGSTLSLALRNVGESDPVFARLVKEIDSGQSLNDAIRVWRSEADLPNRQLTATALELASTSGGASARVLDGVVLSLRDRSALEREVAALSSQSRASAVVLVVAPLAFATVAAAFDNRILEILVGRPIGWACIGLGLGLDGIGALWMARLIGRHR